MKWQVQKLKNENERIITKFLIFPLELNGEKRWLEFVKIKQIFFKGNWLNTEFSERS
jgi:hypothetical protein